jgi:Fe-S cluster assembly scaffold protein SufB
MKFEKGTLKTLKKDGKIFIYAVTTLSSINSSGDHEESIELFELPERKEAEQKAQALWDKCKEMINKQFSLYNIEEDNEDTLVDLNNAIMDSLEQIKKELGLK